MQNTVLAPLLRVGRVEFLHSTVASLIVSHPAASSGDVAQHGPPDLIS